MSIQPYKSWKIVAVALLTEIHTTWEHSLIQMDVLDSHFHNTYPTLEVEELLHRSLTNLKFSNRTICITTTTVTGQYAQWTPPQIVTDIGSNRVMVWIGYKALTNLEVYLPVVNTTGRFTDSGDNLDGGSGYYIQTRSPGGSWSTVQSITGSYDGFVFSVNVPTGEEMKLVYSLHLDRAAMLLIEILYMTITPGSTSSLIPARIWGWSPRRTYRIRGRRCLI